jgi:class 3 adenylate cyclase
MVARLKEGSASEADAGTPFPLRSYFYLGVLPGLLVLIVAVVLATAQAVRSATIEILLQLATHKADGLAKGIDSAAPGAWHRLLANESLTAADLADLAKALADEQREAQIALLKIYGPDRKTLFATEAEEIGKVEDKAALRDALALGTASVLVEHDAQGGAFYELYLPYRSNGRIAAVFELYEPISGFDALLWKAVRPVLIIPVCLFVLMLAGLAWLVGRAQTDINLRTSVITSLRQRIERLVSHRAVAAMRAEDAERKRAEALDVTLYYSDVRGFTAFAERHSPEDVIDFLNRIIGLQVEIIEARGGDVDKMIGDAVLAYFHGPERSVQAIDAAVAVQKAVSSSGLACGVAIGLYGGPVVAGLIGRGDRFDYTVIGDSVNSAARLCGLAGAGEIIADSATATAAKEVKFGAERAVRVKGRAAELKVRSLKTAGPAPAGPDRIATRFDAS